jgi:hypothetical protein
MMKLWVVCINAGGTKWLREGMKYLVQPHGTKVNILRDEKNAHRRYSGMVNKNRFKNINPERSA